MILASPTLVVSHTARALTYLDVFTIDQQRLFEIAGEFPSIKRTIKMAAVRMALRRTLLREAQLKRAAEARGSTFVGLMDSMREDEDEGEDEGEPAAATPAAMPTVGGGAAVAGESAGAAGKSAAHGGLGSCSNDGDGGGGGGGGGDGDDGGGCGAGREGGGAGRDQRLAALESAVGEVRLQGLVHEESLQRLSADVRVVHAAVLSLAGLLSATLSKSDGPEEAPPEPDAHEAVAKI